MFQLRQRESAGRCVPDRPPPRAVRSAERSAVHLEMRDVCGVSYEIADHERWHAMGELDTDPESEDWAPWVDLVCRTVA